VLDPSPCPGRGCAMPDDANAGFQEHGRMQAATSHSIAAFDSDIPCVNDPNLCNTASP
jgi:hypothetical protein